MDVTKYGFTGAVASMILRLFLSERKRKKIVDKRLQALVKHAAENKEYHKELYKDINISEINLDNLSLLPPTNKTVLQKNFDQWLSDENLTEEKINAFLQEKRFTDKYLDDYCIFQTSGTTGAPVTVVYKYSDMKIGMAIAALKSWPSIFDIPRMILNGNPMACILPLRTPCVSTYCASEAGKFFINKGGRIQILDIEEDIKENVKRLNEMQPTTLGAYCTYVEMLLDEADKGNLKISPLYVTTVGEKLRPEVKERISKTFGCCTLTSYACTEGLELAHICKEGHLHVNDDWLIIEPVDENNNPVPDGEISDKILLTNLFNYTQPFIRYEMNDRVIMSHEACACGCKSPWLTVEGRVFKVLNFTGEDGSVVNISPISIEILIHKEDEGINRYQFILNKDNIEIRLSVNEGYNKEAVFAKVKSVIQEFLADNKIKEMDIVLAEDSPRVGKNGKFQQVYQNY